MYKQSPNADEKTLTPTIASSYERPLCTAAETMGWKPRTRIAMGRMIATLMVLKPAFEN